MYEFTPHIERQINNQINQLFDLHNQTTSYITTKFEAIDKTLENLELSIEKLSENFAVTTSLNTRLNQIENSLERINGFINGLGNSLPRQFLQTYMLCKEEINDVKNASLAAIEDVKTSIVKDVKQSISLFTPQLLAISNNLMHECIVTSKSYKDIMQGINIEKHIKIRSNLPLIIENCHFICPNWNFNILTTNGAHICDPIGLTFSEFISNYSKNKNKEYIHKNLIIEPEYIKECLEENIMYRKNMLQQFTQFYQLVLFVDTTFVDNIDKMMKFLRYICSTYTVYRIDDYVITIRNTKDI